MCFVAAVAWAFGVWLGVVVKPDSSRTRPDLLFRLLGLHLEDEEVDAHPHQHTPGEHEDMPYEVRDGFSS